MAMMRWTKIRAFVGGAFAIVVLILFVAIAAAMFGVRIPILADLTDAIGIGSAQ